MEILYVMVLALGKYYVISIRLRLTSEDRRSPILWPIMVLSCLVQVILPSLVR